MTNRPNIKATTTQLLNLAQAKQIVDGLDDSDTKVMLRKAIFWKTKELTNMSHKDET